MWLPFVDRPILYLLNKQITSICWSLVLENCQHVLCSVLISIVIGCVNGVLIKALLHWFDRGLRLDLTNCNPTYIPFLFILCCVRKSVVNAFCLKTDVFRFIGVNMLVRQYSLQQMILELYSKTRLFPFNEQTFIWFHLVCSHHYADIILIRSN